MQIYSKILMLGASFALSTSFAFADCAQDLAALEGGMGDASHKGIAKDGTLAPLQKPANDEMGTAGNDHTSAEAAQAGKAEPSPQDSAVAPMTDSSSTSTAGADPSQAMSGADAQSQQTGGETAAETASHAPSEGGVAGSGARTEALAKARAALDAGDEMACKDALKGLS